MRGLEQIPWLYDLGLWLAEHSGFGRWRRWLPGGAAGRTLDLGSGTGRNLPWLPPGLPVVALDPHPQNLAAARRRAPGVALVRARAEALPFRDGAFDTVLSGMVFCSVDDPAAGLAEVRRVLAPSGAFRLLEHVRSTSPLEARLQDLTQPAWTWLAGGCRPNRETERAVEAAGFQVEEASRHARGTWRRLVARPRLTPSSTMTSLLLAALAAVAPGLAACKAAAPAPTPTSATTTGSVAEHPERSTAGAGSKETPAPVETETPAPASASSASKVAAHPERRAEGPESREAPAPVETETPAPASASSASKVAAHPERRAEGPESREAPAETETPAPAPTLPSSQAPFAVQTPPEEPPATSPPDNWVDGGHALLAQGLFWSVGRLDQFFADEREVDLPRLRSFVRWRNDVTLRDDGTHAFTTSARAELRLPYLNRRLEALRLTISGGTNEALDRLLPGDAPAPGAPDRPTAGLKLTLFETLLTQTDLQAGLLFSWPVGWFTRLRLRHVQPVEGVLVARVAVSGFWQTPTGWGTRQDLDLERELSGWLLLRLANTATFTERSRGWEWGTELGLLAAVGDNTALFLGGSALGASDVGPVVEIWRVRLRARRDVFRRWLYLELEPGMRWERPPGGGHRDRERSVIVRLEAQFDAAARPARPPPTSRPD